jgi:sec-independent protein translocase protein TatA
MPLALFSGMPGPWELILVLLVIVLLFGARRLPELARSLGKSLGEFKKGREEGEQPDAAKTDAPGSKPDQPSAG